MEGSIEAESGIVSDVRRWRNTRMEVENSKIMRMQLVQTKGKNSRCAQTRVLQNIGSIQQEQSKE